MTVSVSRYGLPVLLAACLAMPFSDSYASDSNASDSTARTVGFSTPPGVTLVEVVRELGIGGGLYLWTRLGDEHGRALFTYDQDTQPGISTCVDECSKEFPPAIAPSGTQVEGDWSLVERADGSRQWAYKGKPLYRYAGATDSNAVVDDIIQHQFQGQKVGVEDYGQPDYLPPREVILPPEGWRLARFDPTPDLETPVDVDVKDIPAASALALVSNKGMTLYTVAGKAKSEGKLCYGSGCEQHWLPLPAGELSRPVGDFSLIVRADGTPQWVWQGKPLFTFGGDYVPGDVNGRQQGGDMAVLARHFVPPAVQVREERAREKILATAQGLPLYFRSALEMLYPFPDRSEFKLSYRRGKEVGINACDARCLQTWQPLLAPAEARSQGFWEIYDRPDGTRQWAYKGFAQYTHVGDAPNGSATGHLIYDYVVGENDRYPLSDAILDAFKQQPPVNIYWRTPTGFMWRVSTL